jgi:ribosomal protein L30E
MLEGSAHAIKENAEALVVASKETGHTVNADKTKYIVISQNQAAGRSQNIKTGNSSFESVEEFTYLGTTITHQNSIRGARKGRWK